MKKALLVVLALVLVAALSVGLTMAYLTSHDAVTNTFTVGNVEITLDETDVDDSDNDGNVIERDKANSYNLIPGHKYDKDPIIHVTSGSEKCYVFVKVENGIAAYEAETEGDYKNIVDQIKENGWNELKIDGQIVTNVYYKENVNASNNAVDLNVFANFKIADNAQNVDGWANITATNDNTQIKVTGYAVQADGLDLETAWNAVKDK